VPHRNLRIDLTGCGEVTAVRSLLHGPLKLMTTPTQRTAVLPKLEEIDLLILE
jgi:hypothetical protein